MATTSVAGVMMIIGAQFLVGSMLITEEKLLSGTSLDPMYVVGMEGFWGLIFFGILLPIFQQVECTGSLCHNGRLEDSFAAMKEIG